MEMMLGGGEYVETGVIGKDRELAQLLQHLLITIGVAADRPQLTAFLESGRDGRQHEQHEFHGVSSLEIPRARLLTGVLRLGRDPSVTRAYHLRLPRRLILLHFQRPPSGRSSPS